MKRSCSRREASQRLLAAVAWLSSIALIPRSLVGQAKKAPKAAVQYRDSPQDSKQCSACQHFVAPNACNLVEGEIRPTGWCSLYTVKT